MEWIHLAQDRVEFLLFLRFSSCCVYTLTMIKLFTLNTTIVLFYFISLYQALHVSTTPGHPQVLQIFVYNYKTLRFTFTFVNVD
jgi:hypothetical protein